MPVTQKVNIGTGSCQFWRDTLRSEGRKHIFPGYLNHQAIKVKLSYVYIVANQGNISGIP